MQHKPAYYRSEPAHKILQNNEYAGHKIWLDGLEKFSDNDSALITRALEFAMHHHAPQKRASGEPYIIHPVAVAQILIDKFDADAITIASALLHDTVEDTGATLEDIENEFGEIIRFIVDGTTDVGRGDGQQHIEDRYVRAHKTHNKIHEYAKKDERVYLVKIADRWHNLTTCHALRFSNQERLALETIDFHAAIARELGLDSHADELELLAKKVCDRARNSMK